MTSLSVNLAAENLKTEARHSILTAESCGCEGVAMLSFDITASLAGEVGVILYTEESLPVFGLPGAPAVAGCELRLESASDSADSDVDGHASINDLTEMRIFGSPRVGDARIKLSR